MCECSIDADINTDNPSKPKPPFAEARFRHARRLKDNFLRSPARFLLRDQDPAGIERLEHLLVQEIDAALRFSCQLWSRRDTTPRITGLAELGRTPFQSASEIMELYQGRSTSAMERAVTTTIAPNSFSPGSQHDNATIITVIQPSIGNGAKVWTKARVLVAEAKSHSHNKNTWNKPPVSDITSTSTTTTRTTTTIPKSVGVVQDESFPSKNTTSFSGRRLAPTPTQTPNPVPDSVRAPAPPSDDDDPRRETTLILLPKRYLFQNPGTAAGNLPIAQTGT